MGTFSLSKAIQQAPAENRNMKRVKELLQDIKWFAVALYAAAFVRDKGELKSGKVEKLKSSEVPGSGLNAEHETRNIQPFNLSTFNLSTGKGGAA